MDVSEIKVGMRVVPHSKSTGDPLRDSITWQRCKASGVGYLYVIKLEKYYITCSDKPDYPWGDMFEARDLEPYEDREEYVCSIPGVTAELIPGEKYFVSDHSEADAKVSEREVIYVYTIGGRHYFTRAAGYLHGELDDVYTWKYAVPCRKRETTPEPVEMTVAAVAKLLRSNGLLKGELKIKE